MAYVVLLENKYLPGWDGTLEGTLLPDGTEIKQGKVTTLQDAILQSYTTPACIQPGVIRFGGAEPRVGLEHPRLDSTSSQRLIKGGNPVKFDSIWFDIDYRFKAKEPPPVGWHADLVARLADVPEGFGWFTSINGLRLIWPLVPALDVEQFGVLHKALFRHLAGVLDNQDTLVDPACSSWVHVYHVPNIPGREGARIDIDSMRPLEWTPEANAEDLNLEYYLSALATQAFVLPEEIPAGARNQTLFRYACSLIRKELPESLVLDYVRQASEERCSPPVPLGEIEYMVRKATKRYSSRREDVPAWERPSEVLPRPLGDEPLSGAVVDFLKSNSGVFLARSLLEAIEVHSSERLICDRDLLHFYDPAKGYWQALHDNDILRRIYDLDGVPVLVGSKPDGQPSVAKLKMNHTEAQRNILPAMKVERDEGKFFDNAQFGVAFANGFVAPTSEGLHLVDHSPVHRARFGFPFTYEPDSEPTMFIKFLHELFSKDADREDKVRLIREFFGIALVGYAPKMAKVLFLIGEGSNGKSTLIDILQGILKATGQQDSLMCGVPLQRFEEMFSRVSLKGAFFNIVADMSGTVVRESAAFKAAVTGDYITAARKYGDEFTFRPCAAHIFSLNRPPAITDGSNGLWRRVLTCSFNRQFQAGVDANPNLAAQILSAEIAQIASWLVAGAANAIARGCFIIPSSSAVDTTEWRINSDSVAQFLAEEVVNHYSDPLEGLRISISSLYPKYTQQTLASGGKPVGKPAFSQRLKQLGFDLARTSKDRLVEFPPLDLFRERIGTKA
jgi:P4 family phage/plasmid primase-like protien